MEQINPEHPERYRNAEAALGGADAVEKTTFSDKAHGAEVGERPNVNREYTATVRPSGAPGLLVWVTAILAFVALMAYLLGVF